MFKSNGGFTLVELIVVIAILAILAGIAVPAYSGYIAKANEAAEDAEYRQAEVAVKSACAFYDVDGSAVTFAVSNGTITISAFPAGVSAETQSAITTLANDFYG